MKIQGKINVGELKLPENCPVQVGNVSIDYQAEFTPAEALQMLDLPEKFVDVLAAAARKFMAYDEEFSAQREAKALAKAQAEVNSVVEDLKKQESEKQSA